MSGSVGVTAVPQLAIGPYDVTSTLGEGGHGVVYRARHRDTGAEVALKMVRVPDASLLAGIRREIFALRSVEHPGVARVVDDGVADGQPWYAMEYLGGDTLADVLSRVFNVRSRTGVSLTVDASSPLVEAAPESLADTLPPPPRLGATADRDALVETLGIVRTLCGPLAFVHGEGLVHRDLKPENVVISENGAPVLVDFGLAVRVAGADPGREVVDIAGRALGTPAYMAPEQIRGELVDARADLYALGCMLYECVTGAVPFEGAPGQVLRMHLEQQPPPPSVYVDGLPPALDALVLRLLAKDPRDRMGFATDVAAALGALGARGTVLSGPSPRPYLYRPRLAGREEAIAAVEAVLPAAHEPLRVAVIGGASGVGKTRLAMEVATRASRRGIAVVAGQCVEAGGAPLAPLRPLLLAIADVCRTVAGESGRILGERGPILAEYEPSLRALPGQRALPAPPPLPAEAARDRLLDALAVTLVRYGQGHPTLVVLDDLQWADELTLGLLDRIGVVDLGDCELSLLGVYRSEERTPALAALFEASHVTDLLLGPLEREGVAGMVGDMLALARPPAALVDFLHRESEGNPFYIAEYLRTAVGEGVLRRASDGRWVAGPAAESIVALRSALPMPEGLRGLVRRHLGLLDDDGRRLAEMAAALGRDVDAEVLTAAVALDEARYRRALAALRARYVLEEGDRGQLRFVHDKLREILLDEAGDGRAALHGAAARAIEAQELDPRVAYPQLAHHHALAGHRDEALRYLELAGEQALTSAAWQRARELFSQALALGGDALEPERRARWERRLGVAAYDAGDLAEAEVRLSRALSLLGVRSPRWQTSPLLAGALVSARAVADQIERAARRPLAVADGERERFREAALAAERVSQVYYFKSDKNLSFATALECLHYAERLGPCPELARAYATISLALTYLRVPRLTAFYGARAEAIANDVGDPHAVTWVAFMRGIAAMRAARRADADRYLRRALEVALESGDVRGGQEIQMFIAQTHSMAGERRAALDLARHTLSWAERTRNAQAELWARGAIAKNLVDLGHAADAVTIYDEIRPLAEGSDDDSTRMALSYAALAHLGVGERREARAIADALLEAGQTPGAWHACLGYVAAGETYLALLEEGAGDRRDLARRAERVASILARAARIFRSFAPQAAVFTGVVRAQAGDRRGALRAFRGALRDAADLPAERARAHFELGRHLPPGAERDRHLAEARALFERIEAATWRERLEVL